jgi:hypothetical protein
MRKMLIGGSLLVVFLLMMLPTVAAEEANVAQSTTTPYLLDIQATYLEELREKFTDGPSPQIFLITFAILLLKLLRWGVIITGGLLFLIILGILRKNNTALVV